MDAGTLALGILTPFALICGLPLLIFLTAVQVILDRWRDGPR